MRPQKPFPDDTAERMEDLLRSTSSLDEYRRIQSILFRSKYGYSALEIAKIIGLKPQTVRNIHAAYRKEGEIALQVTGRGGRRKSHLTAEEEEVFLRTFTRDGRLGKIIEVSGIHQAFEEQVGRPVPRSTISRLLHRHGWRKLEPRPQHPKGNSKAIERFKKIPIHCEKC